MNKKELQDELARLTAELERTRAALQKNAPHSGPVNTTGPVSAVPPCPGDPPPAMDPDKGDLTPAYARWLVTRITPVEARAIYEGREKHLPGDVQAALTGAL